MPAAILKGEEIVLKREQSLLYLHTIRAQTVFMDALEQKIKALESFKDWTNYLLITTVAALGWTAGKDSATFHTECMRTWAALTFAASIVFAILVLALIPHIAEEIDAPRGRCPSIYQVYWEHWLVKVRLTNLCLPQHVLFLAGIIFYAVGTTFYPPRSWCVFGEALLAAAVAVLLAGNVSRMFGW